MSAAWSQLIHFCSIYKVHQWLLPPQAWSHPFIPSKYFRTIIFQRIGFFLCVLVCMFSMCLWAFPSCLGFLLQFEDIHTKLENKIGKLVVGVSVSATGCLSLCGSAINQQLIQGVTPPSHCDSWDQLQRPLQPLIGGRRQHVVGFSVTPICCPCLKMQQLADRTVFLMAHESHSNWLQ